MTIDYITQPIVQIQNMVKEFATGDGPFRALDDVSVQINQGEMVAIMGPSGSGKSTLMTMVGLLDTPTSGRYLLDSQEVSNLNRLEQARVRNRKLGFVFQNFNLLPRLTALQNVELPLVYARTDARQRRQRAREALESVGLGHKLDSLPTMLSGGQKQRVAIARAIVHNPAIILADEPTGALDTRTSNEIMALFRELNREQGRTIVLVTHDPEIGRQMDRVIGLRDGRLAENILSDYYGVETLETLEQPPIRERELVPVPLRRAQP
ncbi:ABC transporter ATP-binding protein [Candidatus Viridilinea mediisalina]|uniref:ABC transporter n=1 Tax=Candidatus Viridilinea mediisalina TaxID=2024553 RepID=A0A2A6RFZ7_9CHLR|nr:ABC transporter ATP-binding protein [Candidatus Viridilinea mediisalina]PDW01997.1 ABC transporter [Candidatus Viridilinea mediisalina]